MRHLPLNANSCMVVVCIRTWCPYFDIVVGNSIISPGLLAHWTVIFSLCTVGVSNVDCIVGWLLYFSG